MASCHFNKVFIIQSLEDGLVLHTGERLRQELAPTLREFRLGCASWEAKSKREFLGALKQIWEQCSRDVPRTYPCLHIDAHGAKDRSGIFILPSREIVRWEEFGDICREINIECHNNLLVTAGLCHGLYAMVASVNIREMTPFFALVGAEEEVMPDEVDAFSSFYSTLLRSHDLNAALARLSNKFALYECEDLLVGGFAGYIRDDAQGRGRRDRLERLLTEYLLRRMDAKLKIGDARRIIRERTKPDAKAFEELKVRFLLSEHPDNIGRFLSTFEQALERAGRGR